MAKHYFSFKRFGIHQAGCSMKVSSDGCLFGAWIAEQLQGKSGRALDVGTGTGLLALMVAQRAPQLFIDAVEIDQLAAAQAKHNVLHSPFSDQIQVFSISVQEFVAQSNTFYNYIFTNPPFFENSLQPSGSSRAVATHTVALKYEELLSIAVAKLVSDGFLFIMLPALSVDKFIFLAARRRLLPHMCLYWRSRNSEPPHIAMLQLGKLPAVQLQQHHYSFYTPENNYSPYVRSLLAEYYLYF